MSSSWMVDALKDAHDQRGELYAEIHDLKKLKSLAFCAKALCEWTRHNEFPKEFTTEFMKLTELINTLDIEVRRVFKETK